MTFIKKMFQDSFYRDIVVLMIVSIFVGSLLATSVSLAANSYFSRTLSNLVGDYGEFDLVIQVREEMKEDAGQQIQKIIDDVFPGAKLKEGPTITGKANFFVALPDQYKTQKVYDDLGKTFGSIPGGAGAGVMTDPRLTIRGVPEGAKKMLIEQISQMDGVRFAFHDGASIGVVLASLEKSGAVSDQINKIMKQYQVIEISFPVGSEPANPIRTGEAIADAMRSQLKLEYAQNVSVDGKNDDMTAAVNTMMEMRRFLTAYASQVTITPAPSEKLVKGDVVVFQGTASGVPASGQAPEKSNVAVQVINLKPDGTAEGRIIQGDAGQIGSPRGYKLTKNQIGDYVGTAVCRNPRQQLGNALTETTKLVSQIPGFAQDAQNVSKIAGGAMDNYDSSLSSIEQTLDNVQAAGTTIQAATSGLANIDTSAAQNQIDNSARAIGGLIGTMQVLKLVQADTGGAIDNLTGTQRNLSALKSALGALDSVAANARQAKATIDNVVTGTQNTLDTLKAFDVKGARSNLADINQRMTQVQQINVPLVTTELQYMAASAPNFKDEEISHTLQILDKFIAGQVIPGERIQILTTSNISTDKVAPVVYQQVGHHNVSLYPTSLGVIEPNPRGELYRVLNEVKAILAGITAMVATGVFLLFDHTAIMTVIRRRRLAGAVKPKGWRKIVAKLAGVFVAQERRYGMAVGAVLLTAMFAIAHGGIPYLPWAGVPVLGAMLGFMAAGYCEKISPVAGEEVAAGEALGLSLDEIMREIVIPAARPGILQKLNNRKVKFK
ncbi:MAG: hypothetical protein P4N59_10305 [Negativicutes bacterium]|nr:hypothetical protein [Negativicutes bacterium]